MVAVSAAEQSDWLDDNLPKLLAVMNGSPEVRAKIVGSLAANKAQRFPLTPLAAGLAPGELERLSALINAAVAGNPRYGPGAKAIPRAAVTIMPGARIVRVEVTYPAAPATNELEPGPLTFDVWVCPDRETALALFWCRRGGSWTLDATPERLVEKLLDGRSHYTTPEIQKNENPPGESASWVFPRMAISVVLPKGHKPMPSDRLTLIRGNVVVEASTVEYTWGEPWKAWLAFQLQDCVPDVTAVLRAIDSGLIGVTEREKASPTAAVGVVPNSSGSRAVPRPGVLQVSAAEQSDWLDANVPKLVAVMAASPELRTRIASPLSAEKARPFPLSPAAAGLAPGDVERLSNLIHAAVASNRRYGQGGARPAPTVTVMPETHVVRFHATYPAPAPALCLEPGPLTFDVWICPDRETALGLFWCRKGGISLLDMRSDDAIKQSALEHAFPVTESQPELDLNPPGESAYALNPRLAISVLLPKGREQMPADRLAFVQGNIIVEASTVEFTRRHGEKEWLAWPIRQCAFDVVAILHAINGGLDRMTRRDKPGSDEGIRADPLASQVLSDPKPRAPEVSAAGQSDWLDQNIPKLLDPMTTMAEVRSKIAGKLEPNANGLPPFPLRPEPNLTGLAPEDLDRLSILVDAAVGGNPRYAQSAKDRPRPTATVMRGSAIVRFEIIYPATPAPQDFELGPLSAICDVWVCCLPGDRTGVVLAAERRQSLPGHAGQ